MPDYGSPIADPELLQQLNQSFPGGVAYGTPVDQTTAKFLDQIPKGGVAEVKTGAPSLATDLFYGMRQPIDQGAAMLAQLFPSQKPAVAEANKAGEQAYQQQTMGGPASTVARVAGNMAATAPLAYAMPGAGAAGLGARMLSGAASGAASGALEPVDPNAADFWGQTGQNALVGGAVGAAAPAALSGLSRAVNPNAVDRNALLRQAGVRPTIGQTIGGATGRVEEGLSSWPVVGDVIRSGRARALDQFDRGAINDVLAPIGQKLESDKIGREALVEMSDKVNEAFTKAIPETAGQLTPKTMAELGNLYQMSKFTPTGQQFQDVLKSQILDQISPTGHMSGEAFKNADSALGSIVRDTVYGHGIPWEQRQFGGAVRELQSTMRNWLADVNPAASEDLGNARAAFARQLRIEHAANMTGGEPGKFSAAQLLAGVKKYSSPTQLMRGEALGQPYAEAGKEVLGSKVPDSGTPFRSILALLGGTLGSAALGHGLSPEIASALATAGIGGTAAAGLYSPPVQSGLSKLLSARPPGAAGAAQAIRGATPAAIAAFPWLVGQPSQ